ncbi:hypothetical protein N7533_001965, partial [Penicillium manginii]|uniref:uncharacterized protein n=1 Tax=Penicillium manginii TaxID=203109 RepID=UPI002548BF8E
IEGYKMGPGCTTLDYILIKEFLRWYTYTLTIIKEDRIEIFNWIRRILLETEGTVENIKDPDHSFTKKDFLWVDNRRFIPRLLKATIILALRLYLFTGVRIGAFIPPYDKRYMKGLRYEYSALFRIETVEDLAQYNFSIYKISYLLKSDFVSYCAESLRLLDIIPELIEIYCRVEQLEDMNTDKESIVTDKLKYRKTLLRLRIIGLKEY